jgi:hypothetical protein
VLAIAAVLWAARIGEQIEDLRQYGREVIDVRDPTLSDQGALGLWAPADCVAYFDELTVQALPAALTPAELLLFKL